MAVGTGVQSLPGYRPTVGRQSLGKIACQLQLICDSRRPLLYVGGGDLCWGTRRNSSAGRAIFSILQLPR